MIQRGEVEEAQEVQRQAIEAEIIDPKTTNYVRAFGERKFMQEALEEWERGEKNRTRLHRIESEIVSKLFPTQTPSEGIINNIRRDFAVMRAFGPADPLVTKIQTAYDNEERVQILGEARQEMGKEAFEEFFNKARQTIETQAGNPSNILISDDLMERYLERQEEFISGEAPSETKFDPGDPVSEKSVVETVAQLSKNERISPKAAYARLFENQELKNLGRGYKVVRRTPTREDEIDEDEPLLDYIIPPRLGGSETSDNLRLTARRNHHEIMIVENTLVQKVDNGTLSKEEAQRLIKRYKRGTLSANEVLA